MIWRLETEGAFFIHSIYDDLDSVSEEFRILESKGAVSLMAAPLMHGSQIVGYIAVNDPRRNEGNLTLLQSVSSFVLAELERRIRGRATDSEEVIKARLAKAKEEIREAVHYEHVVVNDILEEAVELVSDILDGKAEPTENIEDLIKRYEEEEDAVSIDQ